MGSILRQITLADFVARLDRGLARGLDGAAENLEPGNLRPAWRELLWQHYEEMRRWNPKLSLVGPGTVDEVVERHYVESLRGLPLIPRGARVLDIGTGGGFPGLVLAVARADLQVVLMEPNQRKCAFLSAALRRLGRTIDTSDASDTSEAVEDPLDGPLRSLSCRVLNARVDGPSSADPAGPRHADAQLLQPLPERVDVVTSRALAWSRELHLSIRQTWSEARCVLWVGRDDPALPSGEEISRQIPLLASRRIVEIPAPEPN